MNDITTIARKADDTKHTPGPLTIDGPAFGVGDFAILDENHRIIGEAYHQVERDEYRPAKENAQLWAAAPDLLTACKGALAALSQESTYPADIQAAKTWLANAIAKAEGDQYVRREYRPAKENAQLWAAAPDLLAACEFSGGEFSYGNGPDMLHYLANVLEKYCDDKPEIDAWMTDWVRNLRAKADKERLAIAKARGDQ